MGDQKLGLFETRRLCVDDPVRYFERVKGEKLQFARTGLSVAAMTSDPEVIQHVLLKNPQNYQKTLMTRLLLEPALGKETVFTSEGEFWRQQRRLAAPAFSLKTVKGFAPLMVEEAQELLARWDRIPPGQRRVDVQSEMSIVTMKIITRAMFSMQSEDQDAAAIAEAVRSMTQFRLQLIDFIGVPKWVPRMSHLRTISAKKVLNRAARSIISERTKSGEHKPDLLGMLLSSADPETGRRMSQSQLEAEVRSYYAAGYETTATALTWVFYALHKFPAVEARLHQELDSVLGGRAPTYSDLESLPYTLQVIKEAMRFYTVVPSIGREAISEDEVQGVRIRKKAVVVINIWWTHRRPDLWEDPELFKPERFSEENSVGRHRFAYIPFGGGPRICIGATFALLEAHLILATIAQKWRLRSAEGHDPHPIGQIVLQPEGGLPMMLEKRT